MKMPVNAKPYRHQQEAFDFACRLFGLADGVKRSPGAAFLMQMGTGKTLVAIAIACIRSRDRVLRSSAERMAINTPVQGLGADCLKLSMAKLVAALKDKDYIRPVLTVHDSLVFEVRNDKIEEATAIVLDCMRHNTLDGVIMEAKRF